MLHFAFLLCVNQECGRQCDWIRDMCRTLHIVENEDRVAGMQAVDIMRRWLRNFLGR